MSEEQNGVKSNLSQDEKKNFEGKNGRKNQAHGKSQYGKNGTSKDRKMRDGVNRVQDVEWYEINDSISKSAGNIPFNRFPGMMEIVAPSDSTVIGNYQFRNSSDNCTPGVFQIHYALQPGNSTDAGSAINVAARSLYSWVRHRNSGHSNYESADIMMYIMAMDEIYTAWLEAKRIYKTAITYSVMNRNIPDLLLRAMGVNAEDIRANLAQFRYELNMLAAKISALAVPDIFKVFKRHAFLASTIAVDSTAQTSQFYLYMRGIQRRFSPTETGGGALIAEDPGTWQQDGHLRTYDQVISEINSMLDPVITDEDMNIISGDILKAFGAENLYILKDVEEYEPIQFTYSEDILGQIENSMTIPAGYSTSQFNINQVNNVIMAPGPDFNFEYDTERRAFYHIYTGDVYFNSHKDVPDYKDCIEWSRNMLSVVDTGEHSFACSGGSEVILRYAIHYFSYTEAGIRTPHWSSFRTLMYMGNFTGNEVCQLAKFDWHPAIYYYNTVTSVSPAIIDYRGVNIDLKRYTMVANDTRRRLNDMAVLGEYGALMLEKIKQAKMNG